jgi:hypothetical protein
MPSRASLMHDHWFVRCLDSSMLGLSLGMFSLEDLTHIIQVALTPVFLLSAIAALLNVFSTRLGRVADRVDEVSAQLESATKDDASRLPAQLKYLQRRSIALDIAVVLATLGGAATSGSALALFVGALRDQTAGSMLFALFGLALLCTIGALAAFLIEVLMAGRGLRAETRRR